MKRSEKYPNPKKWTQEPKGRRVQNTKGRMAPVDSIATAKKKKK